MIGRKLAVSARHNYMLGETRHPIRVKWIRLRLELYTAFDLHISLFDPVQVFVSMPSFGPPPKSVPHHVMDPVEALPKRKALQKSNTGLLNYKNCWFGARIGGALS